jgi:cyclic pyranopterin phosphate synthase
MKKLTHIDKQGRPRMVDISAKAATKRQAIAKGLVRMKAETLEQIKQGQTKKGEVLTTAQLAGIMAAKKTPELIPLCHPIPIDEVAVDFKLDEKNSAVEITSTARSTGKTGVEMEAMTAAAVAALTIYDMCKGIDRGMKIENIRLVYKSGGKSGKITLE